MALEGYVTGTSIGYAGAILAIIILAWWLLTRSQGGRLGLENQKIQQDLELEKLEIKARKEEKKQRIYAKQIRSFLIQLNAAARNAGFNVDAKAQQFKVLKELLDKIIGEKSVTRAILLVRDFNVQKNDYLSSFSAENIEIRNLITSINQSMNILYELLVNEYNDLRKEYTTLKNLEAETGQELAGLNP